MQPRNHHWESVTVGPAAANCPNARFRIAGKSRTANSDS